MKSFTIAAALVAAVAHAQSLDSLPACGKVCVPNMVGQFAAFGCQSATDVACLCRAQNFQYGMRDCIAQACPPSDQGAVQAYAASICAGTLPLSRGTCLDTGVTTDASRSGGRRRRPGHGHGHRGRRPSHRARLDWHRYRYGWAPPRAMH